MSQRATNGKNTRKSCEVPRLGQLKANRTKVVQIEWDRVMNSATKKSG